MRNFVTIIELIFSSALFVNAILFIPQIVKIYREKSAKDVSLITFFGFLLIQMAIIAHGVVVHDFLLVLGYTLSVLTCGSVVILTLFFRDRAKMRTQVSAYEILAQLPGHVYWKDREFNFLGANVNYWKDLNFSSLDELLGKSDYDCLLPEAADKIRHNDEQVLRFAKPLMTEEVYHMKNGRSVLYLSCKRPLFDASGDVLGILCVSVDITAAKQETAKRLDTLENIISLMPGHVYWISKDGRYMGCNDAQAVAAGLKSRQDIIGLHNRDLPWNRDAGSLADELDSINAEVMTSGRAVTVEEDAALPDGSRAIFLSNKTPLYYHDEIIGMVGISIDITHIKQVERELHLAKLQAETANKLKTEFIQNMQHDIRTPISGIWSVMNGFMRKPDPEGLQAVLPHLLKATDELLSICNEVIDFENAAYGEEAILIKPISLLALGNSVIDLNSAAIIARGLYLKLDIAADVPDRILTDVHRLKKILINLIGNAIKFTNQGGITLSIQLLNRVDNSVDLAFKVQDTGIGIPEDKIGLIYDKFTRLNQSNTQLYRGTGLGLFVVKKFVEELGGTVTVTSQVGEGTCFTVKLKVDAIADDEPKTHNAKTAVVGQLKQEQSTAKVDTGEVTHSVDNKPPILIIEDDALALYAAERIFEQLQPEVQLIAAKNKADAIRLLAKQEFKLVISDLGLPDGSGSEIAQHVKQDSTHINHHTPMIALTAHNDIARHQEALNQGFVSVLCKPLTIQRAQQLLNLYLLSESS